MTVAEKDTVLVPVQVARGLRPWLAFAICAILLAGTAVSAWVLQTKLNVYLDKAPVSLHKSLDRLDKAQLSPFRFVHSGTLPDEMVEALGTKDYIQWRLEDPRRQPGDPLRDPILFITYYTGGRALVPHTPERCFMGANFDLLDKWTLRFPIQDSAHTGGATDVSAKVLVFGKTGLIGQQQQTVAYTFYANCDYACEADYLRVSLNKLGIPKAFFSKVEVSYASGDMGTVTIDPVKAAQAAQELLQTLLPVLMREHWPRPDELTATKSPAEP